MDRRTLLAISTGLVVAVPAGCAENFGPGESSTPTADPFPANVDSAERGGADTVVFETVEAGSGLTDGSIGCAREAHAAVRARVEDELGDPGDVATGYGRGPDGFDGMAVSVTLREATYDRDGKLIDEADIELREVVSATPPTAFLRTENGERVCAVPVYVSAVEMHVD